ncbi:MAG: SDR family NAD(P)-dependent oxidoreductase [Firmicutes bacterium]|nr:SDR family NAD(P)-dependent oxidoreductase [Bacillota bacterium]
MKNKIYIVTGATGFVGNVVVKKLLERGETVYALARNKGKAYQVFADVLSNKNGDDNDTNTDIKNLKFFYGDVRKIGEFEAVFANSNHENTDYILIHTAAVVLIHGTKEQYQEMEEVNINGTFNAITLALKYNAKLLYVSSVHAIPEPKYNTKIYETTDFCGKIVGRYAKTKAIATEMVLNAVKIDSLNAVVLHPSGITGPGDFGDSHLTQMVTDYLANKIPVAVKGGYNFVDVRDVVDGILASEKAKAGECYILSNRYYTVKNVLDYLFEITKHKEIKTVLPMFVARIGAPFVDVGAKIKKSRPLYTEYSLYTLRSNGNFSHEKATKELGYSPRELKDSLRDTVEFLREKK